MNLFYKKAKNDVSLHYHFYRIYSLIYIIMKTSKLNFILPLVFLLFSFTANSPTSLVLNQSKSTAKVNGTSTLHDWETLVNRVDGNAEFIVEKSSIIEISALQVNFYSKSFHSGNSVMDDKIFEALKVEKYPKITFELAKTLSNKTVRGGQHIIGTGTLSIAGVTKIITASAFCMVNPQGELIVTGNHAIDMTQYGIVPPKAVFGTIITGKEVTVGYNLLFK